MNVPAPMQYRFIQKSEFTDDDYSVFINWADVAKDYGGIEVMQFIHSRLTTLNRLDINIVKNTMQNLNLQEKLVIQHH
jgi:hypothetical protein